jgi:predicted amidohydrolase
MQDKQADSQLNVALMQADLYWEDVTANLSSFEEKIANLAEAVDVIVLPEMFNTGFTMNTAVAEPMNLTTTRWMKQVSKQANALIIGSFPVRKGAVITIACCASHPTVHIVKTTSATCSVTEVSI